MTSTILIEHINPGDSNIIVESDLKNGKDLWITGVFMQSELKNRNGRLYPLAEISNAVATANAMIRETNGIFGELDHPSGLQLNLDRVSHAITEMKMVGNDAIGRAKILTTPMGNIARALIESGVKVGVSSRGAGNVNESVVSGFNFITVDLVGTPSAPGALPKSIYEGLELAANGQQVISLAEHVKHDAAAQKYFKEEMLKFICSMNYKRK
jgi:hypothetical protein